MTAILAPVSTRFNITAILQGRGMRSNESITQIEPVCLSRKSAERVRCLDVEAGHLLEPCAVLFVDPRDVGAVEVEHVDERTGGKQRDHDLGPRRRVARN